jgi:hypothetical protein
LPQPTVKRPTWLSAPTPEALLSNSHAIVSLVARLSNAIIEQDS